MTGNAYMPLYVGDYLGDTSHLSTIEHGAYMLLLMHYWRHGGLPNDEDRLARIVRMTDQEWRSAKTILAALFGRKWTHKRVDAELQRAEKRRKNAQKAAHALHNKTNGFQADAVLRARDSIPVPDFTLETDVSNSEFRTTEPSGSVVSDHTSKPAKIRKALGAVLSADSVEAVIEHRHTMKVPLTPRAAELLARQYAQAPVLCGLSPDAAADFQIAHGWRGFDPEWVLNDRRVKTTGPPANDMAAAFDTVFGARRA